MFGYFCVKKRIGVTALLVCLVVAAIRVPRVVQYDVMNRSVQKARYCICIDSGHGGNDPGKIGVAGTKEKEVNLAIALKLKKSLEKQNIRVVMTRTDDRNLADANATNEKTSDMKNRVAKMDSEQPDAVISIHQNSYTNSSAKGAQVFYYSESKEGKEPDRACRSGESSDGESQYQLLYSEKHGGADGDRGMWIFIKSGRRDVVEYCTISG